MKRIFAPCLVFAVFVCVFSLDSFRMDLLNAGAVGEKASTVAATGQVNPQTSQQTLNASRAAREEKAIQDARRQQLSEKEAAMAAKEQELNKLGTKLDTQIKAMEESKKRLDESVKTQKKAQDEKRKKMIAFFKKMRAEQAGQLMNKLDENLVISMLDNMDTKTIIKLVPFLSQPRVLKWINENLKGT
jgi:flagellar protein FlbB